MRPLDEFLPSFEFRERHALAVDAPSERVDRAVREVTLAEMPVVRALFALRGVGRGVGDAGRPLVEAMLRSGVLLEDVPREGVVLGITGQFWRIRGGFPVDRPTTCEEFSAYDRPDVAKAVLDLRVLADGERRSVVTTETRVHVASPRARRKFARYWRVARPFSGLTRILLLRAARTRAEATV